MGSAEFQVGIDLIIYFHKSSILSMFTEPGSLVIYRETFVSSRLRWLSPLQSGALQQSGKFFGQERWFCWLVRVLAGISKSLKLEIDRLYKKL